MPDPPNYNVDPDRQSYDQHYRADQEFYQKSEFLGIPSFGRSTLVEVAEINAQELETVILRLAEHLVAHYGAPDIKTALPAAQEEVHYALSLCNHEPHTLIALDRELEGEEIIENFKRINPPSGADHSHIPQWELISQVNQETN